MTSEMVPSHYISTGTIFHLIGRGRDSITAPDGVLRVKMLKIELDY